MPSRMSLLPDVVMALVRQQDHHQVATTGGVDDGQDLQALLARLADGGGVGAQADDHVDAGVLQVERVGVALGAVADDRDGLAVQERGVCVVVVEHGGAGYRFDARFRTLGRATPNEQARAKARGGQALAEATSVRPGIASVPSGSVKGFQARGEACSGSRRSRTRDG